MSTGGARISGRAGVHAGNGWSAGVPSGNGLNAGEDAGAPSGNGLNAGEDAGAPSGNGLNAGEDAGVPSGNGLIAGEDAGAPSGNGLIAGEDAGAPSGNGLIAGEDAGAPSGAPKGWYSRGYLPHCDSLGLLQSITYRLSDSLPREMLDQLQDELATLPDERRNTTRRQQIEAWLDAGMGCCALRHPDVARYVQDSFLHFHGERYYLHAWCVMPNHVHVLIEPASDLASIVRGWKSFTARWILKNSAALGVLLPEGRALWMREYWDRYIRDENHYRMVVDYIHQNPVKAGLCAKPEAWPWSSAGSSGVLASTGTNAGEDAGAPRNAGC